MDESAQVQASVTHPNLYVKPVLPHWSDDKLLHLFSAFGEVDSVRLSTSTTGATNGARVSHAFVRFKEIESAMAAIQALNGFMLEGHALMVKPADSDVVPRVQGGQVPSEWCYCRGIPATYTLQDICALFMVHGTIVDIKHFPSTEYYQGSGALVQMETIDQSSAAIQTLNGCVLPGASQPLIVRYADSPAEKAAKVARKEKFVTRDTRLGLAPAQTAASLQEQLQLKLLELSLNQGPPGGYVNGASNGMSVLGSAFSSGSDSVGSVATPGSSLGMHGTSAIQAMNQASRGTTGQGCSLYIKGMPEDADKLWLYEKFARFGAVQSVRVLVDEHTGKCNGIGFVNYSDPVGARLAHETMNGVSMGDRLLHVMIQNNGGGRTGGGGLNGSNMNSASAFQAQRSFSGTLPQLNSIRVPNTTLQSAASQPLPW